jgi:glycine/serine hydroxymethyltransferase
VDVHRRSLAAYDPEIFTEIAGEERRQSHGVEMIRSENHTYPEVLAALGSVLTDKYAEGHPGRRCYGRQAHTDATENLARQRAGRLFGDMKRLSAWMVEALRSPLDVALIERLRGEVQTLCQRHPVPTVIH